MTEIIVYNRNGFDIVGRVTLKHAATMLFRQVARVEDEVEGRRFGPYPLFTSVRLVREVVSRWLQKPRRSLMELVYERTGKVLFSRANVMARDNWTCAYCSAEATTWDHVIPRVQGGESSWTNCVAACRDCNEYKGGRTPEQADMPLRWTPRAPRGLEELFGVCA